MYGPRGLAAWRTSGASLTGELLLPVPDQREDREARADHLERLLDPVDQRVAEVVGAGALGPPAERQLHADRAADVDRAGQEQAAARGRGEREHEPQGRG